MEFDKNKILTVVTADQARIGQKGWFSNHPNLLKSYMERQTPDTLKDLDMDMDSPFYDGYNYFNLFYPAPEPTYRPYNNDELNDLVGKMVTNKYTGNNKLVTERLGPSAVRVGDTGCTAKDLFHYFTLDGKPCGVREEA